LSQPHSPVNLKAKNTQSNENVKNKKTLTQKIKTIKKKIKISESKKKNKKKNLNKKTKSKIYPNSRPSFLESTFRVNQKLSTKVLSFSFPQVSPKKSVSLMAKTKESACWFAT
jgi:hypothetical protein